ncbi:type II toxin-antitoxin system VapC family toxin [Sphingomonas radiodurans]|nr:type II toxin-antitoxin system VapC family toxin [Sphingomonas radiodurans]WBH18392.1 type II toxin-antitoxin system VapC family toxin [Sphingomonas radiodurans]
MVDTQALVWAITDSPRLSSAARSVLVDVDEDVFISAVTAFEFVDLNRRGRFGVDLPFEAVLSQLEATVLATPAELWTTIDALPPIHRDPVDRMLIAHAVHADLPIVTADAAMSHYPVRIIW